eukprot:Lankesteria_metandrocarpae@DN1877_c0_g1_i1.p1
MTMKVCTALAGCVLLVCTRSVHCVFGEFVIFGYVPEYRLEGIDWQFVFERTTHVALFSVEASPRGEVVVHGNIPGHDSAQWQEIKSLARGQKTKLLVTVGGAGRSTGFTTVLNNRDVQQKFLKRVSEFAERMELDGLDFDITIPAETDEQTKLADFFANMKSVLKTEKRMMTLAVHPGSISRLPERILTLPDLINVMAYDNWCAFPAHAKPPCRHSEYEYATDVLKQFLPLPFLKAKKVVLGLPFYGRHVTTAEVYDYKQLIGNYSITDDSIDEVEGIFFNSPATLRKKIQLAFNKGLAGVMLWELGQDARPTQATTLLDTVARAVKGEELLRRRDEEF